MSTRAYKVEIPAVLADFESWNVTHDNKINNFLGLNDYEGEVEITVEKIEELLAQPWLDDYSRARFEADIKDVPADGNIFYQLF